MQQAQALRCCRVGVCNTPYRINASPGTLASSPIDQQGPANTTGALPILSVQIQHDRLG